VIVYLIYCISNGKVYIGKTVLSLDARWQRHLRDARGTRYNTYFYKAIRKHGPEAFSREVICEADDTEKLNALEIFYIGYFKANQPTFGYNMTAGGDGLRVTEELRQKLSESHIGKTPWNKGRKITEEERRNLSIAHMGIYPSAETTKRHSQATKEQWRRRRLQLLEGK
jgi:group I intron endonuclease